MFQFPSNGKAYPKKQTRLNSRFRLTGVSIPFKRESVSKDGINHRLVQFVTNEEFQFPSNGKAYPKNFGTAGCVKGVHVSIPFKRESVSKAIKHLVLETKGG